MRFLLFLLYLVFSESQCFGQEQFGAAFSNYTPTQSVFMNPSSMLDAKTWLDIHVVGAGSYANNDLAFLKNSSLLEVIREGDEAFIRDKTDYNFGKKRYNVYNRTFVNVLSGVWSQGNHAAGVFFNMRSFTNFRGIPSQAIGAVDDAIQGNQFEQNKDYTVSDLFFSSLSFGEVQLSYGHTFFKQKKNMLMGGISIKKFIPLAAAAGNVFDARFNQNSDTSFAYVFADADVMYTSDVSPIFRGGMGIDLGFTYQKMIGQANGYLPNSKKNGCRQLNYKYKVGVSILDIGSVRFDPDVVQSRGLRINFDQTYFTRIDINRDSAFRIIQSLDTVLNDEDITNTNRIRLPTAFSVQFDYNIWNSKLYFNAALFQGVPTSETRRFGNRRPNSLMLGLRYESKFFDLSIPVSLYEYFRPQIGVAMRLGWLTVGTDKFLSWTGPTNVYGADIYASLRIPIFYYPPCKSRMKKVNTDAQVRKFKRKANKCPAYD